MAFIREMIEAVVEIDAAPADGVHPNRMEARDLYVGAIEFLKKEFTFKHLKETGLPKEVILIRAEQFLKMFNDEHPELNDPPYSFQDAIGHVIDAAIEDNQG